MFISEMCHPVGRSFQRILAGDYSPDARDLPMIVDRPAVPDMLVITYLHMTRRDQFCPAFGDDAGLRISPIIAPDVDFYRSVYRAVGERWRWRDRLIMPDAELK